ncbi:hypothetical protein KDA_18890 [Dictyobacter alpinus]|uniref:Uncharacterized protein n=1 Tax=Dictyobacter alpinus TaxID=2014873 RepID=A0A402B4X0_9CHLR|nr:hypothetical protein [Dictyobacter alpinus]GCE26405.1 hypothetical protein KDA_18890 [Dictyobacter alpinus]
MRKREILPHDYHMTIAEINQRFYPIHRFTTDDHQELDGLLGLFWSNEDSYGIPMAVGPRHTTGLVSFPTYAAAINYCHRRWEDDELLYDWKKNAARCELYPERNVWYTQELQQLTGNTPLWFLSLSEVHAWVALYDGTVYSVDAGTIDEAMCQLYEEVAERIALAQTEEHPTLLIEQEYASK